MNSVASAIRDAVALAVFISGLALALMALPAHAKGTPAKPAAPMTCDAFKDRLRQGIEAAGNLVLVPDYKDDSEGLVGGRSRYEFSNISGISGDLNCVNGLFDSLDIGAPFDNASAPERIKVIARVNALASAALCVAIVANQPLCDREVDRLFSAAFKEVVADDQRGDKYPSAHMEADYPSYEAVADASPDVLRANLVVDLVVAGTISVAVFAGN
jgi:hypothetical protein